MGARHLSNDVSHVTRMCPDSPVFASYRSAMTVLRRRNQLHFIGELFPLPGPGLHRRGRASVSCLSAETISHRHTYSARE